MSRLLVRYNLWVKYLVAAILLSVPLYPKFPFIVVSQTSVSIRLEDFLLVIAFVFVALFFLKKPDLVLAKSKISRAIIIFLTVGLISFFSAVFVTQTVVVHVSFLHWARRIEYLTPFFLGIAALKLGKEDNLRFFIKVLMIVVVYAFVYGFGQRYLSWPIITTQNEEYAKGIALRWVSGSHISSTFAGHYDLASFLVLTLPIFINLFFLIKNKNFRVVNLLVIFSGLWLLAFAGSRISAFSYLVAATTALVLIRKYKAVPIVLTVSILFFSFSPNMIARYTRIIEIGKQRLRIINTFIDETSQGSSMIGVKVVYAQEEGVRVPQRRKTSTPTPTPKPIFEDRSTSIRLNVEWPRAIRAFSKNPLLGTGYSSITLATDNDYLRLLGEVGVLGLLAFFLIFARLTKLIVKASPLVDRYKGAELGFLTGFIGALPGVFLNALFIDIFEASKFAIIFWLLTGFAVERLRKSEK